MSGLIIVPIILIYIFIAFLIYKLILRSTNKKLFSRIVFITLLIFPFWDVLLQNVTAIYYSSLNPNFKVYHQAELDKNEKVESIAYLTTLDDLKYYTPEQLDKYDSKRFNLVSDFLEFLVKDEEGKEKILKIKKLSQGNYKF